MSKGLIESSLLTGIADAIRSKNGESETYTPAQMARAIENISTSDVTREEFNKISASVNNIYSNDLNYNYYSGTVSGTRYTTITLEEAIPAGECIITIESVESSDTQYENCRIIFYNGNTALYAFDAARNELVNRTFTLNSPCDAINFYGAHTWADSADVAFAFNNVKVFVNSLIEDRLSENESNIGKLSSSVSKNKHILTNCADIFVYGKYFSHIGVDKTSGIIIPNQSSADILRAKRLGFKCVELNVRDTKDQKLVCLHGYNGNFGYLFEDVNGNSVTDVPVNSLTLSEIKSTIRFKSKYQKYKTPPYTLEELLPICKKYGIIPMVEYQPRYSNMGYFEALDGIMGKDNYIVNLYNLDRGTITDAPCSSWLSNNTPESIVAKCNASGGLYYAGMNVTHSNFSEFTRDDWKDLISAVHSNGYRFSFNEVYSGFALSNELEQLGADCIGSGHSINDFEIGNIGNWNDSITYRGMSTTGTINNGEISLSSGNTVSPILESNENVDLGGGILDLWFIGSISLTFGGYVSAQVIESDGSNPFHLSTLFEEELPTFSIVANSATRILDLRYRASSF